MEFLVDHARYIPIVDLTTVTNIILENGNWEQKISNKSKTFQPFDGGVLKKIYNYIK